MNGLLTGFNDLREQDRMTWSAQEHGWLAAPEEMLIALSNNGFEQLEFDHSPRLEHDLYEEEAGAASGVPFQHPGEIT